MSVRIAAALLAAFLVGLWTGRALFGAERSDAAPAPQRDDDALHAALDEIRDELDALAQAKLEAPRAPIAAPHASPERAPIGPAPDQEALDRRLAELNELAAQLVELLVGTREALEKERLPASYPTLELLESVPDQQNEAALQQIIDEHQAGGEARELVRQRLRWTPQVELLRIYGRPRRISDDGTWTYGLPGRPPGVPSSVQFRFVLDYAMSIRVF